MQNSQNKTEDVLVFVKRRNEAEEFDEIEFEICRKCGVKKIFEEVVTNFSLELGTFKITYIDADSDNVLISNDADLQLCPKKMLTNNTPGSTINNYITLFAR